MDPLMEYNIPIQGLNSGLHRFEFRIGAQFFNHFENSLVDQGNFDVIVEMDKRPDMLECLFTIEGSLPTNCDRCLAPILMPINGEQTLLFKFTEDALEEEDEIVFIPYGTSVLDLSQYIYEAISLSIPLVKMYDCENEEVIPCSKEMLDILKGKDDDKNTEGPNPIWDALKGFNDN
jgi:uncharacterized protein